MSVLSKALLPVLLLAVAGTACSAGDESGSDESSGHNYSSDAYRTCAACHLPDGAGVPGAFPPLRDRVAKIAALDGGRDYLITAVSYGLMGNIQVDGMQYFGVMPGNLGQLTAADIAAALNYLVFELGDADDVEPFSEAEVQAVQDKVTLKSPAAAGELRGKLAANHADQWP